MPLGEIFIKWKPLSQAQQDLCVFQAYWLLHQPLLGGRTRNAQLRGLEGVGAGGGKQKIRRQGDGLSVACSVSNLRGRLCVSFLPSVAFLILRRLIREVGAMPILQISKLRLRKAK